MVKVLGDKLDSDVIGTGLIGGHRCDECQTDGKNHDECQSVQHRCECEHEEVSIGGYEGRSGIRLKSDSTRLQYYVMTSTKRSLSTLFTGFGLSAVATYIVASIFHTQTILHGLTSLGVSVSFMDRLRMTAGDLSGLMAYSFVIAIGLLIAFSIMGLLGRILPLSPWIRFPIGGMLAMLTMLLVMKAVFSITPIASARELSGLVLQCSAGLIGGLVFARVLVAGKKTV